MVRGFTIDGKLVVVVYDDEGRVLYIIFPTIAGDTAGNPFYVSFNPGMTITSVEALVATITLPA